MSVKVTFECDGCTRGLHSDARWVLDEAHTLRQMLRDMREQRDQARRELRALEDRIERTREAA